jgi:hypothetical protein
MQSYHDGYNPYEAQKIPGATPINQKIFLRLLASVLGYSNITKAAAINNPAPIFSGFEFSAEKIETLSLIVPLLYELVSEQKNLLLSDRRNSTSAVNPMFNPVGNTYSTTAASAPPMTAKMNRSHTTLNESLLSEGERYQAQEAEAVPVELTVIDTSNHDYLLKVLSVYMRVVDPQGRRSSLYQEKPSKDKGGCCDGPCYCDCGPTTHSSGSDFWFYMWLWGPHSPHSGNSAGACDGCGEGCASCGNGCEAAGKGLGHALTSCGDVAQSTVECGISSASNVVTGGLECVLSIFMDSIKGIMACGGDIIGLIGQFCGDFCHCCTQCCSGGGGSSNDCGEIGGFGFVAVGGGGAAVAGAATAPPPSDEDADDGDDNTTAMANYFRNTTMYGSDSSDHPNDPTHSPEAKIAIYVILAVVCFALLPSIGADLRRICDDISHGRSISQNVTKFMLLVTAVIGAVMCTEFAGYDILTDLAWGISALYAFSAVYNTWILDNRNFGQSFTLDCKTFNTLVANAKTNSAHNFDAKTFMSNLGDVLAEGQAEYRAQSKPASDAPLYERMAYAGWRGAFYGPVQCDNLDKIYNGDVEFAKSLAVPNMHGGAAV